MEIEMNGERGGGGKRELTEGKCEVKERERERERGPGERKERITHIFLSTCTKFNNQCLGIFKGLSKAIHVSVLIYNFSKRIFVCLT